MQALEKVCRPVRRNCGQLVLTRSPCREKSSVQQNRQWGPLWSLALWSKERLENLRKVKSLAVSMVDFSKKGEGSNKRCVQVLHMQLLKVFLLLYLHEILHDVEKSLPPPCDLCS
jgi:hypothetical protein